MKSLKEILKMILAMLKSVSLPKLALFAMLVLSMTVIVKVIDSNRSVTTGEKNTPQISTTQFVRRQD